VPAGQTDTVGLAGSVDERSVVLHIKDILDLRETLLADARAQMAREPSLVDDDVNSARQLDGENESTMSLRAMDDDDLFSDKDSTVEPDEPSLPATISPASGLSTIDVNIPSAPKFTAKKRCKGPNLLDPLWPSQAKRVKVNRDQLEAANTALLAVACHPNMDASELCTNDIADNELHLYIKSEEEIVCAD